MKMLKNLFAFVAGLALLVGCMEPDLMTGNHLNGVALEKGKNKEVKVTVPEVKVTVPFKAVFIGNYIYAGPDEKCGSPFVGRVIVDLNGTGTHLGKFTGNFDFCFGPEGYGPTESYMVAANGDSLFVSCQGIVVPGRQEDHPEYVTSYWRDPFVILGGTGRFEGATGSGMTDDYNSSLDPNSHHHWRGTITMIKGKR